MQDEIKITTPQGMLVTDGHLNTLCIGDIVINYVEYGQCQQGVISRASQKSLWIKLVGGGESGPWTIYPSMKNMINVSAMMLHPVEALLRDRKGLMDLRDTVVVAPQKAAPKSDVTWMPYVNWASHKDAKTGYSHREYTIYSLIDEIRTGRASIKMHASNTPASAFKSNCMGMYAFPKNLEHQLEYVVRYGVDSAYGSKARKIPSKKLVKAGIPTTEDLDIKDQLSLLYMMAAEYGPIMTKKLRRVQTATGINQQKIFPCDAAYGSEKAFNLAYSKKLYRAPTDYMVELFKLGAQYFNIWWDPKLAAKIVKDHKAEDVTELMHVCRNAAMQYGTEKQQEEVTKAFRMVLIEEI